MWAIVTGYRGVPLDRRQPTCPLRILPPGWVWGLFQVPTTPCPSPMLGDPCHFKIPFPFLIISKLPED